MCSVAAQCLPDLRLLPSRRCAAPGAGAARQRHHRLGECDPRLQREGAGAGHRGAGGLSGGAGMPGRAGCCRCRCRRRCHRRTSQTADTTRSCPLLPSLPPHAHQHPCLPLPPPPHPPRAVHVLHRALHARRGAEPHARGHPARDAGPGGGWLQGGDAAGPERRRVWARPARLCGRRLGAPRLDLHRPAAIRARRAGWVCFPPSCVLPCWRGWGGGACLLLCLWRGQQLPRSLLTCVPPHAALATLPQASSASALPPRTRATSQSASSSEAPPAGGAACCMPAGRLPPGWR